MDEIIYSYLTKYYDILSQTGHLGKAVSHRLLVLSFLKDYVMRDYRGILTEEDYRDIEKALECLYGSNCLMSYPDYLKMGKLHLGDMTELATRLKNLEDTSVVKAKGYRVNPVPGSDIEITQEREEEQV